MDPGVKRIVQAHNMTDGKNTSLGRREFNDRAKRTAEKKAREKDLKNASENIQKSLADFKNLKKSLP